MKGTSVNLELPADTPIDRDVLRMLNERLRRIAGLSSGSAAASSPAATSTGGGSVLLLSVPGTLSIRSNAAPLVSLPGSQRFTEFTALLKRPFPYYRDGSSISWF